MTARARHPVYVVLIGVAVVLSACLATQSYARDRLLSAYNLRETGSIIILPSDPSQVAQVKVAKLGDRVLSARLGLDYGARVHSPLQLSIAGFPHQIEANEILSRSRVRGGEIDGDGSEEIIYCTGELGVDSRYRRTAPMSIGSMDQGARLNAKAIYCLWDTDRDANFDRAFLIGTNWREDRVSIEIEKIAYTEIADVPVYKSEVYIEFTRGPLLLGLVLAPRATHYGLELQLTELEFANQGLLGKRRYGQRSVGGSSYPRIIEFGQARIAIHSFDEDKNEIVYSIENGFERSPVVFVLRL